MPLREYQQVALDRLRHSVAKGNRRIVLQSATGSGKTVLGAAVVSGALAKNKRIGFTAPAISLIDQTVDQLITHGIPESEIGVIQAKHPRSNIAGNVQVISVASQMRRDLTLYDVVLVDECHEQFEFVYDWMNRIEFQHTIFIGLSATPWARGMGRDGRWQDLIVAATIEELIAQGWLSRFRVFAPSHPDLSKVGTVAGDYNETQLSAVMSESALVADVVENWRMHGENRPTFVFAVDRAHAQLLQAQFEQTGVPTGYIDHKTPNHARAEIRRQFHNGDIKVVVNVECLTTGVDWDVRCIVLARPTKSEILLVQMIGRGLRIAPGKDHLLVFDHTSTTERLGFVTDIHHEKLDARKPREKAEPELKAPLPKPCPKCSFLKPPKMAACPVCGFVPAKRSSVEYEEGELAEMDESPARKRRKGVKAELCKLPILQLYGGLKLIAQRRGYSPKWATAQYKEITDRWPGHDTVHAEPCEPPAILASWVKSQQIRFAKGKGKKDAAAHPAT